MNDKGRTSRIDRELAPVLLFFMVVAMFYGTLSSNFTWHDRPMMDEVSTMSASDMPAIFMETLSSPDRDGEKQYRPAARTSILFDHMLWGADPKWRHVENILLHYIVVLMFYFVVLNAFDDIRIALFSSVLFALHPLAVEPVNSVMARDGMLAALFMMVALKALMRARPGHLRWGPVAIFAFALSIFSIESSILLGLFLALMFFLSGKGSPRIRASAIVAFLLTAAAYLYLRVHLHWNETYSEFLRPAFWDRDMYGSTLSEIYKYLTMMTMPFALNVGYALSPVEVSSLQGMAAISSFTILLLAVALPWSPEPLRAASAWILVFSLPFLNSLPYSSLHISDRYVYLALPGICLLTGWAINALLIRNQYFGSLVLACMLVVLGVETYRQNIVWTDDFTLWDNAVKRSPVSAYANYNQGRIHDEIDARAKAITFYDAAVHSDPMYFAPYFGLGNLYKRTERYDLAISNYSVALLLAPDKKWINLNLGDVYAEKGQWGLAINSYMRYLEEAPGDPTAHHKIAVALQGKGDYEGAQEHFDEALSSWPGYAKAHYDYSQLLLSIDDRESARHELKLALLIKPEYSEARKLLKEIEGDIR